MMEKQHSFLARPASSSNHNEHFKSNHPRFTIYIDGASRGNPGPSGAGIYILDGSKAIIKSGIYLGKRTNNQAEYLGLTLALFLFGQWCKVNNISTPHVLIISDSLLLVKQMSGAYKVKNPQIIKLKMLSETLFGDMVYQFTHVLREKNKEADALANLGIDKKNQIPTDFLKILSDYDLS